MTYPDIKLTKKQVRQVHKAAEMIETGEAWFCCQAIDSAAHTVGGDLRSRFFIFYFQRLTRWWGYQHEAFEKESQYRAEKVMALLWFAEVCGD